MKHSPDQPDESLEVGPPAEVAGGVPAIVETTRQVLSKTGIARGTRALLALNQQDGFDCPGCAWPDPKERSAAEFCENGAKAVADEATTRRIDAAFFAQHSIVDLLGQTDQWLNDQGRLTRPMRKRADATHYEPISWDEAFDLIGEELRALDDPDEAAFYTSGRTSNEAAFLYQLFARSLGTNNLPDCSNMCHESSGVAMTEVIGIGKGTVLLEDFDLADVIFVFGQNPGTNHPRMMTALQRAARNGCRIVSVNPLKEAGLKSFIHPQEVTTLLGSGTRLTELFVQVKPNGDVALIAGLIKAMLELERATGGVIDQRFVEAHTTGYDALVAAIDATTWDEIVDGSGVTEPIIRDAAEIAAHAKRMIACWAMGLTQHRNGVANVQAVMNLLLLGGHIGRPGAGACPVRGHSNVQGDRTVGITERPSDDFLDRLAQTFGIDPPREHGLDTVHAIKAMHAGGVKVFVALGGNFLSATPDTNFTADAIRRCRLTVQVSTKLNRSHLVTGQEALILPCLGRTERIERPGGAQFVTVENSMGLVHRSRGKLPPASPDLLSEPEIVARLAVATLGDDHVVPWMKLIDDFDAIRDRIALVVPGFEHYNQRVRNPNGFELPNGPRHGEFPTDDGKAHFTVHPIAEHDIAANQLMMMTFRSHDQYNTTIYSSNDRYRGIEGGRRVVFMNPHDVARLGLHARQRVHLESTFDGVTRTAANFAVVPYDMPPGAAGTYFPEANVLVPIDEFADRSHTPASKSIVIRVRPA